MTSIWYKWLSHENSSVISSSNSILHGCCVFSAEHLHLSVTVSWWRHLVNRCKVTDMLVATHYRLVIMATLRSRCRHYIFALWFLSFYLLFSSPNLSGCRLDVYHTFTHGVALVRIQNAGLKCAARGSLEIQDTNGWDLLASLGHPCNFQRVSHLGSVTARHSSYGRPM